MPRIEFMANLARPEAPADYKVPNEFPQIHQAKRITLDVESYDPEIQSKGPGWRRDAKIIGIGVNADNEFKRYYPLGHIYGPNCGPDAVWSWLRSELNGFRGEITGANTNLYDLDGLQLQGVKPWGARLRDIQWAEPLLDENSLSYSLNSLAEKYLGKTKQTTLLDNKYGPKWIQATREVHPAHIEQYVFGDIDLPGEILDQQLQKLQSENLLKLYDLECRLAPMLLYMRNRGVRVDLEKAKTLSLQMQEQILDLEAQMEEMLGFAANYRPSDSLIKAFEHLKIKFPLTEKGNPSITNDFLRTVKHPFAQLVSKARELDKINGTFIQGYILDSHINGRIHCEFHPLKRADEEGSRGTVSGRFSSTHPNLQNIPVRTELGRMIRELFIPEENYSWWSLDYSQIEYRLLVHFAVVAKCKDAKIAQQMYIKDPNTDFHKMVAELTGLDRKPAKNLNFGLVYGMGKAKLARTLGLDDIAAAEVFEIYHGRAPFIKELFNKAMNKAQKTGWVKTILNRRARFDEWEPAFRGSGDQRARTHKSLNRILQGSAADLIKLAMLKIWDSGILYEGGPINCSLTVHDELNGSFEPSERGRKALKEVQNLMENAIRLKVPVLTEMGQGSNWGQAH
jgi:DNA polymerase-1